MTCGLSSSLVVRTLPGEPPRRRPTNYFNEGVCHRSPQPPSSAQTAAVRSVGARRALSDSDLTSPVGFLWNPENPNQKKKVNSRLKVLVTETSSDK